MVFSRAKIEAPAYRLPSRHHPSQATLTGYPLSCFSPSCAYTALERLSYSPPSPFRPEPRQHRGERASQLQRLHVQARLRPFGSPPGRDFHPLCPRPLRSPILPESGRRLGFPRVRDYPSQPRSHPASLSPGTRRYLPYSFSELAVRIPEKGTSLPPVTGGRSCSLAFCLAELQEVGGHLRDDDDMSRMPRYLENTMRNQMVV